MRFLSVVLLCCSTLAARVSADTYRIEPSHTYPYFAVDHLGFSLQRGRFDKTTGHVELDWEKKSGEVDVVIETDSLSSGDEKRDRMLKGSSFFNVEQYPEIRFVSDTFEWMGEYPSAINGQLTLLGERRPVTLRIKRFKCGFHLFNFARSCGAEATTTIKRSDFGMKSWLSAVGDEVSIDLQIEAIRQ